MQDYAIRHVECGKVILDHARCLSISIRPIGIGIDEDQAFAGVQEPLLETMAIRVEIGEALVLSRYMSWVSLQVVNPIMVGAGEARFFAAGIGIHLVQATMAADIEEFKHPGLLSTDSGFPVKTQ